MKELKFQVKTATFDVQKVLFRKAGNNLTALCSCAAGTKNQLCKHRLAILLGDDSAIVSDNVQDAATVRSWLIGSDVQQALHEMADAARALENAQEAYNSAKIHLLKTMLD
ncbi:MAG: hypothetical protein HQL51_03275 [Magnetococcales bacterium]|nr:hypothetical protein [Magnetococcales bacterium]